MATPDYNSLLGVIWGNYYDSGFPSVIMDVAAASNILVGTNPAYSAADFLVFYPQFGSGNVATTGTTDGVTAIVALTSVAGLTVGMQVFGNGIIPGSTIVSISGNNVTLSAATTIAGANITVVAVTSLKMPVAVMNAYIYLASSSIMQQRYQEMWLTTMAYFIAHYLTLYLISTSVSPNATASQVATSGLAIGLKTSKSAGDVSVGSQYIEGLEDWGTFNLTVYGQMFATIAKALASAGMLIY